VSDVLIAAGLSRWFVSGDARTHAVRKSSVRVAETELVAVLGPSGSGKTALLSLCGGLDRPDQGRVIVDGHDLTTLEGTARDAFLQHAVGWVFQRPRLLPLLTVEENVAVVLRIAGQTAADAACAAKTALEAVGLTRRAGHRADELSAAEQRRVAIARALVKAPALLIADEPTAHMDAVTARGVVDLIRAAAESGAGVLMATQDPEAAAAADRVLWMNAGTLTDQPPER
jgi:putative ABC transport system ATP-binding protein